MKAMILAAGLGTRLLPYTAKRPKPLFPILNKSLLHLTISRIRQVGGNKIVVNAHHLRSQIKKAVHDAAGCTRWNNLQYFRINDMDSCKSKNSFLLSAAGA